MAKNKDDVKTKPVPGGTIKATAVINQLTVGTHGDKISFTALHLSAKENEIMSNIIQDESPVAIVLDLPKPDSKFPPIEVRGGIKKFTINKTCDIPALIGVQFSSNQVERIANYIRASQEISLKIVQLQGKLFEEQEGEGEGESTE
jgi:hypothetical protein